MLRCSWRERAQLWVSPRAKRLQVLEMHGLSYRTGVLVICGRCAFSSFWSVSGELQMTVP